MFDKDTRWNLLEVVLLLVGVFGLLKRDVLYHIDLRLFRHKNIFCLKQLKRPNERCSSKVQAENR